VRSRWGLIDYNPAKRGVPNPVRRSKEERPFESWQQIEAVAERLGPVYGPMVVFAAATGLRPSELLFALEHRDLDRADGVVYVLLLKPARHGAGFQLAGSRPPYGAWQAETSSVAGTILGLSASAAELNVIDYFETAVAPQIVRRGRTLLGYFVTESHPNNFPRLPVREGERVFVWFEAQRGEGADAGEGASSGAAMAELVAATPGLAAKPETLRLRPTARSLLNATSAPCVAAAWSG